MIDRVLEFSIRNRWLVIAAGLLLALAGIYAVYHTPVDAIPDLSENQVIVFAEWPGHSPPEIEDQVTYPLSLHLQGLAGVRVVRSSSDVNFAMISVIFEDGVAFAAARDQVARRLAHARDELPPGVVPHLAPDAAATGQIFWYTVEGPGYDLGRLRAVQDWYVRPQLSSVPGVAEVASVGGHAIEYAVAIDPRRLRAHGLLLPDVLQAVARSRAAVGGGVIHKANAEYIVRAGGWVGEAPPRPPGSPGLPAGAHDGTGAPGGDSDSERTVRDLANVVLHFRTSFVIALTLPLAALASFAVMWLLRKLGVADIQTNIMSLAGIAVSVGVLVDSSIVMAENVMHRLKEHFGDRPVTGDVRGLVLDACRTVGRPIFFSVVIMLLSFLPVFVLGGIEGKMFRPLAFTKCFALVAVAVLAVTLVPALCTLFIRGRLRGEMDSWVVRGVVQAYRPVLDYMLAHPAVIVWIVGVTFVVGLAPLGSRAILLGTLVLAVVASVWAARRNFSRALCAMSLVLLALIAERYVTPLGYEPATPLDEGMVMDMPITVPWASVAQAADDLKARDMVFCRFPEVDMVVGKAGRADTSTDPAPLDMIETMVNFRPQDLWPRRKLRPADAERQARAALDALRGVGLLGDLDATAEAELINEAVMAILPTFDAQMREFAYQRNQEFERHLGRVLISAGRAQLVELLVENGSLARRLDAVERARLGDLGSRGYQLQLARDLTPEDVGRFARETVRGMEELGFLRPAGDPLRYRPGLLARATIQIDSLFGGTPPDLFTRLHEALAAERHAHWGHYVHGLNGKLLERASAVFARLILEEVIVRTAVTDSNLVAHVKARRRLRVEPPAAVAAGHDHGAAAASDESTTSYAFGFLMHGDHNHGGRTASSFQIKPHPLLDRLQDSLAQRFADRVLLWPVERSELAGFGGELDRAMQMPGWTNVWTMPIQNRVDMLATGVNTAVGVRVLGRRLADVVRASEDVAAVVAKVPGAVNVLADRLRGKGYLEIRPDHDRAARLGVSVGDVNELVEVALGGKVVAHTVEGRERHPVRVRCARAWRADEESIGGLPVPVRAEGAVRPHHVPLSDVADVRIVEGPATIKSENSLLRNYVRLNVRGRDTGEVVEEARRAVAARVELPPGVFLEWTGQFEHEERARHTLQLILPLVLGLIFAVLYWTYHDLADAALIMLTVPGALAGGVFFQWLFGVKFSVTVWVGYIACFGMATATGILMLVYLREAVARRGGLGPMSLDELRQAILEGAVQRLRPKLLTEGTMILGLAPLLWTGGVGADVIKPMVIPVLGGILVADEVIDLFLPVLFYAVRRWRWQRQHAAPTYRAATCPHCGLVIQFPALEGQPNQAGGQGLLVVECCDCGSAYRC